MITINPFNKTTDKKEFIASLKEDGIHDYSVGIPDKDKYWEILDREVYTVRLTDNSFAGVLVVNRVLTTADFGGWCVKKYQAKGYVQEAINELILMLKQQGIHKLTANTLSINKAAKYLLRRMKFRFVGTLKEQYLHNDKYVDVDLYEKII